MHVSTHTHTLSLSLTHTHTHSLSHTHTHTHSLSLTQHTHTHSLSLSHTHTHTHTLSLSLSHTHTHTHHLNQFPHSQIKHTIHKPTQLANKHNHVLTHVSTTLTLTEEIIPIIRSSIINVLERKMHTSLWLENSVHVLAHFARLHYLFKWYFSIEYNLLS